MKKFIILLIVLLAVLFYVNFMRFESVTDIDTNSFALKDNKISENLINKNKKNIKSTTLSKNETLYKQNNNYFVGITNRKEINAETPIVSEDNSTLYIFSDSFVLINSLFQKNKSYYNMILANGQAYNLFSLSKNEDDKYYFINIPSGPFINLFTIKINTSNKEKTIKENSYIIFDKDQIRFYSMDKGVYVYNEINALDDNSRITFDNKTMTYSELKVLLDIEAKKEQKQNIIEKINKEVINETKEESKIEEAPVQKEIIPEVNCKNFEAKTYSINSSITINDPFFRIKQNPTFEIKQNGKIFLRKSVGASGKIEINGLLPNTEYEIEGYFTYINEKNQQVKRNFFNQKIKTQDISNLETIELNFDNDKYYSNYIQITNFKILNDESDEVLKGIKDIIVEVGDNEYKLSSTQVNKLKKLESINYSTSKNLESDTKYTAKIIIQDLAGNVLKIKNDTFESKTSKAPPIAKIENLKTDIFKASFDVKIENQDKVPLSSTHYIVYDTDGKIVKQENFDSNKNVEINDLDQNKVYNVIIYGDYDLEDGNGMQKDQKLEEIKFSTKPISTLGYIRLKYEDENILQNKASYMLSLNTDLTAPQLVELLNKVNIKVIDSETNEIVIDKNLTKEEITQLQSNNKVYVEFLNLNSKTTYTVETTTFVKQGIKEYEITAQTNLTEFKTLKKDAEVAIKNKFTNENIIDFDVKIIDDDGAIESDIVYMEVRNEQGNLVHIEELKINDDYQRITLDKLEKEQNYTFTYIATSYNVGYTNKTFEENKILHEETLRTDIGIHGTIELDKVIKNIKSNNIFNIDDNSKWRTNGSPLSIEYNKKQNTIQLSAKNSNAAYYYYIPEYTNRKIIVSFYARYTSDSNITDVYIGKSFGGGRQNKLDGLSEKYKKYDIILDVNASPYFGFHIDGDANQNLVTTIEIKNLQVRDITDNPDITYLDRYEKYEEDDKLNSSLIVNIDDSQQQLEEDKFYVQILKDKKVLKTEEYDMKNPHQSFNHYLNYKLDRNSDYVFNLCVKIRDRLYIISTVSFNTKGEIRSIKNADDLYNIHDNGNYIVSNDLDIRGRGEISAPLYFDGTLDFQGHKLIKNIGTLINRLSKSGIIKNLDLYLYMGENYEYHWNQGLLYDNLGTIENIKVTLEEGNEENNDNLFPIARTNYGTLRNFVIYSKESLVGSTDLTLAFRDNFGGTIENGYIYGEPIKAIYSSPTGHTVGTLALNTTNAGTIKNVYSLITVQTEMEKVSSNDKIGNIVGSASGNSKFSNIYTYDDSQNRDQNKPLEFGNLSSIVTNNMFYISDKTYYTKYSNKASKLALYNQKFQNKVINSDKTFDVDNLIKYGYFPHVIWPDCMPNQEYIPLPEVEDKDLIDVISVDEVNQNGDKATAMLTLNNPGNEKITSISLKNIDSKILDQTINDGETQLTIELSNPTKYVSKYYIREITSVGAFGIPYTRKYDDYERALDIDMYRQISSVNDWKQIKNHKDENYILTTDLDFSNVSDISINTFNGKLNGNNHKIKNIRLNNDVLFNGNFRGVLENLFVENYTSVNNTSNSGGLINVADSQSIINNVHLKNVVLEANQERIGGLVGYANNTTITNCSVNGLKVNFEISPIKKLNLGGLVGMADYSVIENSFVSNIEFKMNNQINSVGGLVGSMTNSNVTNVYATGEININSQNAGGLVGINNDGNITNAYSYINLNNNFGYNGGILGYSIYSEERIANVLSVGDMYLPKKDIDSLRRISGNQEINGNNYAWVNQKINGVVTGKTNGEMLLSTEELNDKATYIDKINLGEGFNYDNIGNNSLPLLNYSNSQEKLPNQEITKFTTEDFNISNITVSQELSKANILLEIDNPLNYQITGIEIEGLSVDNIIRNVNQNSTTYLEVEVSPEKAYDSYRLTNITYLENNKKKTCQKNVKIDVTFYKDLSTFDDWQKISKTDPENYRLINDIDFAGKSNINTDVVINRLEGMGETYSLKNIELTTSANSIIDRINTNIENVNFENISVEFEGNESYRGIIRFLNGNMTDVNFSDINIIFSYGSEVAPVAQSQNSIIRNVNLKNINVDGNYQIAGFISDDVRTSKSNINLTNITVKGGSVLGGMSGWVSSSDYNMDYNIIGDNIKIVEKWTNDNHQYSGGIYGYGGRAKYVTVKNSNIAGDSNVGGIFGSMIQSELTNFTVSNTTITGRGNYIGGISNHLNQVDYATVDNCKIYGVEDAQYVGGLGGSSRYINRYLKVTNSTIENVGKNTGGMFGIVTDTTINTSIVYNTSVTGANNVGGMVGDAGTSSGSSHIQNSIVNAYVTATNSNAGGLTGYLANKNTTETLNTKTYNNNLILRSAVSAPTNAGGMIGQADKELIISHFDKNYLDVNLTVTNQNGKYGILVGNGDDYAKNVNNIAFYESNTVNGTKLKDMNIKFPNNNEKLVTLSALKDKNTYTDVGLNFDFNSLSKNLYPQINNDGLRYDISLPTEVNNLLMRRTKMLRNEEIEPLPAVFVYQSDVNKINIEFSKITPSSTFTINNEEIPITKRTYTFEYNFIDDLKITVSNGINDIEVTKRAKDLIQTSTVINQNYYIIENNKIKTNDGNIKGTFISLYKDKALMSDGNIYDLKNKNIIATSIINLTEVETVPLYESSYDGHVIKTYLTYSTIDDKFIKNQLFVKNNQLEMIDSTTKNQKNMINIDEYNGESYIVILKNDGKMETLKGEINYPENFKNRDIKSITSNIEPISNLIVVTYNDGDYICFDYHTGKVYAAKEEKKENLFTYYKAKISEIGNENEKMDKKESLKEAEDLVTKLKDKSIDEVLNNKNSSSTENLYKTVYSSARQKFVVYDLNAFLDTEPYSQEKDSENNRIDFQQNNKSELDIAYIVNDQINNNLTLSNYYYKQKENHINWFIIFILLFFAIIISLIILFRVLKKNRRFKTA